MGGGEGKARLPGQHRVPAGTAPATRWQRTRVGAPWGQAASPAPPAPGTRGCAMPGTLGLNSLNQANTSELRKGKESKTKHHRKVRSLVFMEFES